MSDFVQIKWEKLANSHLIQMMNREKFATIKGFAENSSRSLK